MEQCPGLGSERQGMTALPLHLVTYKKTTADPPEMAFWPPKGGNQPAVTRAISAAEVIPACTSIWPCSAKVRMPF